MDPIRINGNQYDYGCYQCKVASNRIEGITTAKYSHKRERVRVTGMVKSRVALGVTPGKYNPEDGSLTCYTATADFMRTVLVTLSGSPDSYGDALVPIVFTYQNPVTGLVSIDELRSCWIIGDGAALEDNADPTKEEIAIGFLELIRNGKHLSSRPF